MTALRLAKQHVAIGPVEVDLEQLVAGLERLVALGEEVPALLVEEEATPHTRGCARRLRLDRRRRDLLEQIAHAHLARLAEGQQLTADLSGDAVEHAGERID